MPRRLETRKELLPLKQSIYEFRTPSDHSQGRRGPREVLKRNIEYFEQQLQSIPEASQRAAEMLQAAEQQYNALDDWGKSQVEGQRLLQRIQGFTKEIENNQRVLNRFQQELAKAQQQLQEMDRIQEESVQEEAVEEIAPAQEQVERPKQEPTQTDLKNKPAEQTSPKPAKDPREKEKSKARRLLRKAIQSIVEDNIESGESIDDRDIMMAVLEDEQLLEAAFSLAYTQTGYFDEDGDYVSLYPENPEDAAGDAQIAKVLKGEIAKAKKIKVSPLFENTRKQELEDRTKTWNLFDPESITQEEVEMGESDPDYMEYREATLEALKKDKRTPARYQAFKEQFEPFYEKAKMSFPSQNEWVSYIATMPYGEWLVRNGEDADDFQRWRMQEAELAERVLNKPLSEGERARLESHLTADNYAAQQESAQKTEQEAYGPGIRRVNEPPADLGVVPTEGGAEQQVYDLLSAQGIDIDGLNEEELEALQELIQKAYAGQIDQKTADLLKYDPDIKRQLESGARKLRRLWGPFIADTAAEDVVSITYNHLLEDKEKNRKQWTDRLKNIEEKWENQDSRIDRELLESGDKSKYLSQEYKKFLKQKIHESVGRIIRTAIGEQRMQDLFAFFDEQNDFTAEQMFRDWALGEKNTPGSIHSLVQAYLDIDNVIEGAYTTPAKAEQARFVYDLLYNPGSDIFIGYDEDIYRTTERSERRDIKGEKVREKEGQQINWDRVAKRARQMGYKPQAKTLNAATIRNYNSTLVSILRTLFREQANAKTVADRAQEGFAQPTTPPTGESTPRSEPRPDMSAPVQRTDAQKALQNIQELRQKSSKLHRVSFLRR